MKKLQYTIIAICCLISAAACSSYLEEDFRPDTGISNGNGNNLRPIPGKDINEKERHVLTMYLAGFNSLYGYLKADIEDITQGWLPRNSPNDNVLLIYSHLAEKGNYNKPVSPVLIRVTRDEYDESKPVLDTLVVYDKNTISSSPEQFNAVLSYVKESFDADHYGLIISSHSTGYLPAGYTSNTKAMMYSGRMNTDYYSSVAVPYTEFTRDSYSPEVKSICSDREGSISHEMELTDFAESIPFKLDYILFDTCLMGGIEVAYELKDKCDLIAFSQTEILAEGFNYKTLTSHLLENEEPAPIEVCKDYFEYYDAQTGIERSATISLIDCNGLDKLAKTCKEIFANNRKGLDTINCNSVQGYYDHGWHWFYDLEDTVVKAGASETELNALREALDDCVIYKAHTPSFLGKFRITTHSGFSMFIPANGSAYLKEFYKSLKWNEATSLVD
ncbi:MAG: hypothetical protein J6A22_06480 [Bacteroidales bacterium]|nr:hypothetical protein [Bacteroidales bacterium]